MAKQLFINVNAPDIRSALVTSPTNLSPVAFPTLVLGDGKDYELYFVTGIGGAYASFSGDAAYTLMVAIGVCGYPSGGTAVWTFGANSTAAQPYNVTPAALQTALQALASIGSGNVLVAGVAGQYYSLTFVGALAGAPQPEVTVNFAGFTPAGTVEISTIVIGASGVNAVQLATLSKNPITFADNWTPITNGWAGSLSTRTLEVIQAFSVGPTPLAELFQVTLADPAGVRTTYLKTPVTIECTIIDPESFAGAAKPSLVTSAQLAAAVLGLNNFTREALTSSATGNTNITRPSTSRHHTAVITVTGTSGTRTLSVLTTNSPNAGDTELLAIKPAAVANLVIEVRNATSAGTLIETITTTATGRPYFVLLNYTGSAWQLDFSDKPTATSGGIANAYAIAANSTGNTTISRQASNTVQILNITGTARTSVLILDISVTVPLAGDVLKMRLNLPPTASIIVEVRNATAGGTLIYSFTTDGSGDDGYLETYFDGTAWQPLLNIAPVV